MAQLNYVADLNDQFTGISECLPAGEYKVQIIDTDIVSPKSGDGEMVKVVYEVVADQTYDGRKIFDNLIIHHSSADAVRIGKQKLNTICALTGTKNIKDTAQLHGKTLSLLIGVKEYQGQNQNTIKKYLPFDDDSYTESKDDSIKKPKFIK
jgi:hypothetical protein